MIGQRDERRREKEIERGTQKERTKAAEHVTATGEHRGRRSEEKNHLYF
ncbi:hypothetical protein FTUN_7442 [Frigoriglobus tundricola]|uniref:Uncharacterized protein n=1 Tax=Frigoriglobus tundricola TaxID=2774151 RepID=A0A6M5Z0G1_9BACT|nr:hypothetical protein FTUN_7442 [Frigoriglobus tundricola]